MTTSITDSVLVPVADEADARATAEALQPYDVGQVTVLHVVEKGAGVPDKTPVEQSESIAADAFATFRNTFPDADTKLTYRRDVVGGIIDTAEAVDARAIAFRPREAGRLVKFLAGDRTLKLIMESDRPTIALPGGRIE